MPQKGEKMKFTGYVRLEGTVTIEAADAMDAEEALESLSTLASKKVVWGDDYELSVTGLDAD
jgi:hypothetical protein